MALCQRQFTNTSRGVTENKWILANRKMLISRPQQTKAKETVRVLRAGNSPAAHREYPVVKHHQQSPTCRVLQRPNTTEVA